MATVLAQVSAISCLEFHSSFLPGLTLSLLLFQPVCPLEADHEMREVLLGETGKGSTGIKTGTGRL